jgi:hypothetical protein
VGCNNDIHVLTAVHAHEIVISGRESVDMIDN